MGDSLFEAGNFREAYLMYERAIFHAKKHEIKTENHLKKALCYKNLDNYKKAKDELLRVNFRVLSDSMQFRIRYELILCSYFAEEFTEGISQVKQMRFFTKDRNKSKQIDFLEILLYNELNEYSTAAQKFKDYYETIDKTKLSDSLQAAAVNLYAKKNIPKKKSIKKAKMLSTFIPGTGQMYAGYPLEGGLSLTLQLASLCVGAYGICMKYYISGYFIGFGLFQKFYFGGIHRAQKLAARKNEEQTHDFNEKAKAIILLLEHYRLGYI